MKIAIIGGGAAGMMVAATLLEKDFDGEIHLFDKNESLGKKVIISGGGRCNVTTGLRDEHVLLKKYIRGADFLKFALKAFSPERVYEWFEKQGVPLKIEEDLRVFPVSDDGHDIVRVFEKMFLKHPNVHIHLSENVVSVTKKNNHFQVETRCIASLPVFDVVVLTTGGNAYQHTGSTGDGYDFTRACGHTITPLGPSLNSFETKESWCKNLSGISFPEAEVSFEVNGKQMKVSGPFLFTHFGISGPLTFIVSAQSAFEKINPEHPFTIRWLPEAGVYFEDWESRLQKAFSENGLKQISSILDFWLPKRLVIELLTFLDILETKKASQISKEERRSISHILSGDLKISLMQRRPGDEFVTAGGVDLSEVNPKTMESKICPNLYFAGEILNIDGVTGGFNLQSSWATGRMAGEAVLRNL